MQQNSSVWRYFDVWLLTAVIILTLYGVLMISSAITNVETYVGYEARQLRWMAFGLLALFTMAAIDYRILTSAHWYIYLFLVGLLLAVAFFGQERNNVVGWINLGPASYQPAEL